MSNNKKLLILNESQRVDKDKNPPSIKSEVNKLLAQEQVRLQTPISSPFSEKEIDDMVKDYERTINKSDFERRALYAARSTIFVAGFGIPALLSTSRPTGVEWLDGFGVAGIFCLGFLLSKGFSKKIRDRQLRDVAASQYSEAKLSDLANKKFQQSHSTRIHKEVINHLNEKINFNNFEEDGLQKTARKGFIYAAVLIAGINVAAFMISKNEINYQDKMDDLMDSIKESIDNFIQDDVVPKSDLKKPSEGLKP